MTTSVFATPTQLFKSLCAGNVHAQEVFCERYGERVAVIARRCLSRSLRAREGIDTMDVSQESLVSAISGVRGCQFQSERAFLGWLTRVVKNRIHDRARRCRVGYVEKDLDAIHDGRQQRPSESMAREESLDLVAVALELLSRDDRRLIVDRMLLQLPWSTIAELRQVSIECAQMRFTRAKGKLCAAVDKVRDRANS